MDVTPYFASYLRALLDDGVEPPPSAIAVPASALLTDISGFTALTSRLSARGREGAEEIASLVDRAFAPAIEAIEERFGGSVATFGGDALLSLFLGDGRTDRALGAARAVTSALEALPSHRTSAGEVSLAVSQVLHEGEARLLFLGTPEYAHHAVAGETLRELARLEAGARSGELVVTDAARGALTTPPCPSPRRPSGAARLAIDALVPPPLRGCLGLVPGAFRRVAVVFVETSALELPRLHEQFLALAAAVDAHGGLILKSDVSPAGLRWLCLFGCPVAHEDDPVRALRSLIDLTERTGFADARAGFATGIVASLDIGASRRRSFDVMGDAVNLAARACEAAFWGETLAADGAESALPSFAWEVRPPRAMKGIAEPLRLAALLGRRDRRTRVVLRRPEPRGRSRELALLGEALHGCRGGRGATVVLEGDAGVGKTRLAEEIADVARARGCRDLWGRARSSGGAPYHPLADVLRDALGEDVAAGAARLSLPETSASRLLELVSGGNAGDGGLAPGLRDAARAQAAGEALAALASSLPLVIVLDDMQWADDSTRSALPVLTRMLASRPVMLLVVGRSGTLPEGPHVSRMRLSNLALPDTVVLVRDLLGAGATDRTVADVAAKSGGNPLFATELARHVAEGSAGSLPESLETVLAARLLSVSPATLRVAQAASVFGSTAERELLAEVLRGESASDALRELAEAGILVAAGRDLAFTQALLGDVAYASILAHDRRELHEAAAGALAERGRDEDAARLAHHYAQIGDAPRAHEAYLRAARRAIRVTMLVEAERLYRCALDHGRDLSPGLRARILLELADSVVTMTRGAPAARELYQECLREAEVAGDEEARALALRGIASGLSSLGEPQEARRLMEEALGVLRACGDRRAEATTLNELGSLYRGLGESERASATWAEALRIVRELGDRRLAARAHANVAVAHHDEGRVADAEAAYRSALEEARAAGDDTTEGLVMGNLAVLLSNTGRVAEAREKYMEALAIHRRIGHRRAEAHVLHNLGVTLHEEGRLQDAREHFERALPILRSVGDAAVEANCHASLANVLRDMGDLERARELHADVQQELRRTGNRHFEAVSLASVGTLESFAGHQVRAREILEGALALHRELHERREEGTTLEALAGTSLLLGDVVRAREQALAAIEILREVDDERWLGVALRRLAEVDLAEGDAAGAALHLEEALVRLRKVRDRRNEGLTLVRLARARRHAGGVAALGLLPAMEGRQILQSTGDRASLAAALAELAICLHQSGGDGASALAEAQELVSSLAIDDDAPLVREVAEAARLLGRTR